MHHKIFHIIIYFNIAVDLCVMVVTFNTYCMNRFLRSVNATAVRRFLSDIKMFCFIGSKTGCILFLFYYLQEENKRETRV